MNWLDLDLRNSQLYLDWANFFATAVWIAITSYLKNERPTCITEPSPRSSRRCSSRPRPTWRSSPGPYRSLQRNELKIVKNIFFKNFRSYLRAASKANFTLKETSPDKGHKIWNEATVPSFQMALGLLKSVDWKLRYGRFKAGPYFFKILICNSKLTY